MWKDFALPIIALMFCAGCATGPKSASTPEPATPEIQTVSAEIEYAPPTTLPAEPELDGPHAVDFYVQFALERNPEILAAQHRVAAQSEVVPQVTALNDPMLMDTFFPFTDNSPQTAAGRAPNMVSLSQQFPWLGKLRLRGEVAEQQANIALTELAAAELRTIEAVKLAYYDLWFNQQAVEITQASGKLLDDLLKFAEARYRTGGSQQDVLRAQLEVDRLQDQLIRLRRDLRVAQADLAKLLHTSPDAKPEAAEPGDELSAPEQVERLYEVAASCRPELQQQLYAIVRDQRGEELARLNYYPDVNVGVSWQAITGDDAISPVANSHDNVGLGIGVNLPIWREKLRAGVCEAEHRAMSSVRQYDATRDDTFRLIKRLTVQARALDEQVSLFEKRIIPRAEQTLRVSVADYRVGKVDFQQIIDNWMALLQFKIQLVRLETGLGQTLASLERVVGCRLAEMPEQAPGDPTEPSELPPAPAPLPPMDDTEPAPTR